MATYNNTLARIACTNNGRKFAKLLQELRTNGGVTVYNTPIDIIDEMFTVEQLQLNTLDTGYVVGDNRCSQVLRDLSDDDTVARIQLAQAIISLWQSRPSTVIVGLWLDTNTSTVYVDSCTVVATQAEAMNLGASRGELAVWNIGMMREIRL